MKKNALKYGIDVALFSVVSTIAALGLMLGFIIPRGRGGQEFFLGLNRHAWGDLHLYLSLSLFILLPLHLAFNWTWIVQSSQRYLGLQWKNFLWGLSGAWLVILLILWLTALIAW